VLKGLVLPQSQRRFRRRRMRDNDRDGEEDSQMGGTEGGFQKKKKKKGERFTEAHERVTLAGRLSKKRKNDKIRKKMGDLR